MCKRLRWSPAATHIASKQIDSTIVTSIKESKTTPSAKSSKSEEMMNTFMSSQKTTKTSIVKTFRILIMERWQSAGWKRSHMWRRKGALWTVNSMSRSSKDSRKYVCMTTYLGQYRKLLSIKAVLKILLWCTGFWNRRAFSTEPEFTTLITSNVI